jgi:colanic acid/amylovoran biosynthesis glycosyltransferase
MRVAYLINQYPKVSHSFIRREIHALERRGVTVMRIAVRGWNDPLVDADDIEERKQTRYVLQRGTLRLAIAFLQILIMHPVNFLQALAIEIRMARRSERTLLVHLVYLAEACQVLRSLRQEKIEIDHMHAHFGTNSAEVAMLVHLLGGPPWSFTVHGPEEFDKPHSINLKEKIHRAAFVVAISSYGRSQLFRLVKHSYWPKIRVVHCGLDHKFFGERYIAPITSRTIVCVGRLCEQKGQLLLLEAAKTLSEEGIDFTLVLAGDGEMRAEIETFIDDHRLRENVRITGWISNEQVRNELRAARALVLPSFAEGLPVAIMEAMALGRPVISTLIAGIPELVTPDTGWLVPAGDLGALVNAIRACLGAECAKLGEMGTASRLRVRDRHDSETEAAKLHDLFLSDC